MLRNLLFRQPRYEVAVVIPVYRCGLSGPERVSLDRCLAVLGHHQVLIAAPEGLDLTGIDLLHGRSLKIVRFPAHYFASVDDYSRLMLSIDFYSAFIDYRFILIHQLDAFVFSDQLLDWCRLSFDYIGAPWVGVDWLAGFSNVRYGLLWRLGKGRDRGVGNGGFSLRNVKSFLLALLLLGRKAKAWSTAEHEDLFWSFAVPDYLPFFRIPDSELAVKFAFETEPRACFERNSQTLPFGCHGWDKIDTGFWRPVFKECGYSI